MLENDALGEALCQNVVADEVAQDLARDPRQLKAQWAERQEH